MGSSNEATDEVVAASGGLARLLARLSWKTGEVWAPTSSWGAVRVGVPDVAEAMRALLMSTDPVAEEVRALMRQVPDEQAFGVRSWWAEVTGQRESDIGVKAGWDLTMGHTYLRTHVVVMGPVRSGVVLSAAHVPVTVQNQWQTALAVEGPSGVLSLHEEHAGPAIRAALGARQAGRVRPVPA